MKLVRFAAKGDERIGAVVGEAVIDLAAALQAARPEAEPLPRSMRAFLALGAEGLKLAREAVAASAGREDLYRPLSGLTLLPPVGDPQKIICIGQNYRDHCEEQNQPLPERPIIFAKYPTALIGPGAAIKLPRIATQVDYEAELAFVIGRRGKNIPQAEARSYVAGYMCLNDVSARDIQFGDKQWVRGKTFDTFAPTGPALTTADEVPQPETLDISLTLNGQTMQKSNTSNLVFGVDYLVSYLSQVVTLEPGDIVTTGTPGGVGIFRKPPVLLKPGDQVSVTIQGLGTLTNHVEAE